MKYTTSILSAILILAIATACGDSSTGSDPEPDPVFGTIEVEVVTTGEDDDPDGYTVSVEGGESKDIGPNGTVTFTQVNTGSKTVTLSGIADHCTVEGSLSETFTLGDSEARTIEYQVSCTAIFRDKILFMRSTGEPFEYQIYSVSPDGSNMRMVSEMILYSTAAPAASPDGLKVVFSGSEYHSGSATQEEKAQIWVQNSDGSGLQNLTNDPEKLYSEPVWSPDGSKIALSRFQEGASTNISVMDADGSNRTNITNDPDVSDYAPSWSPDGNELVFFSVKPNPSGGILFSIAKINADGSGRTTLLEDEGILVIAPKWSPDGSTIAFERFEIGSQTPRQIHLMNADGTNVRNITAEGGNPGLTTNGATWSPDGNRIAFYAEGGTALNIFIMNLDGEIQGGRITNGTDNQHHSNPSWSPYTRN